MKNTNKKNQVQNKNLKNVETKSNLQNISELVKNSSAIKTTKNTTKKKTLKSKVLKQTMYLLKVNPNGLKYSQLVKKCLNRIKTQDTKGTINSVQGCLQKAFANGELTNLIEKTSAGFYQLKSIVFALFF